MRSSTLRADLLLMLTALIWGSAFVAQRVGMESMGPLLFTGARFALGALFILPLALRGGGSWNRELWLVGGGAGLVLFVGAVLQQVGLVYTTAGKAGFITGLYVVMVPLLGFWAGQRATGSIWVGVVLSVAGLYLISVTEEMTLAYGDAIVLCSAVFWALHVVLIGRFAGQLNPVRLAIIQFAICSVLSTLAALAVEPVSVAALQDGAWSIVYGGVVSVGIGYTLQVVAQREALASHAAIILSLEAVFAALAGWLFLNEQLDGRELTGCALMLGGMMVAQLGPLWRSRKHGLPQGDHPA